MTKYQVMTTIISGLALIVSVVAGVISYLANRKANKNVVRANELQEQMLGIERQRDADRLAQQHRANVVIKLQPLMIDGRVRAWQLVLVNNGRVEARNIRVKLDGRSIDDLDWVVKPKTGKEMPLGAENTYSWHIGSNWRPPPWDAIVEWDDESGQPGRYQTTLTQVY